MRTAIPLAGRLAAVAALALAVGLGGCVSVFPKTKPAQLYAFGRGGPGASAATPTATAAVDRTGVLLAGVTFPRAAQGDTILAMTGMEAAYIGESRWVAPAVVLFREAVERRFEDAAMRTRLVARGDLGRTSMILRLDVREFEAVYPAADAIPDVAVSVHARLVRADGTALDDRVFEVRRAAADNRVGAIVAGLDQATTEIVGQVVDWTDAAASSAAAPQPRPS